MSTLFSRFDVMGLAVVAGHEPARGGRYTWAVTALCDSRMFESEMQEPRRWLVRVKAVH